MKTWDELTPEQQEGATEHEVAQFLAALAEGGLHFVVEELEARVQAAWDQAEAMQTPWFFHEYVMDDPELRAAIGKIAAAQAQDALYPEPGEYVSRMNLEV